MRYRRFGPLDWRVSALGFGIMRLPHEDGDPSKILEEQAAAMVRHAIDSGVNYLDTAYNYHEGESEVFLGKVLENGYRDRILLATKLPCWLVEGSEDFDRYFDRQLEKLRTDHVDFYLLHGLQDDWWERLRGYGYLDWVERQMADGRIGHPAFSFHDRLPVFRKIVDDYRGWTMAMVMYNYMDVDYQAGMDGVRYAADRGLAVVVMEPLRGGLLGKEPPDQVKQVFRESGIDRSPAEWALQWLWDQPEVSCVISGMSSMDQLVENLGSAGRSGVGSMKGEEKELLIRVRNEYHARKPVDCTGCRYCMPCPQGVAIPRVLGIYNLGRMYEDPETARMHYSFLGEDHRPPKCNECGTCMEKCPQHLDIIGLLRIAHEHLAQ
ncbi:MAG: aldo/keto reductase [Candidatus Fermentibacteraceae bacterium]|nr:aldo/keto reductase [Candidatus Fermentibacteraceae bacterium]